MVEKIVEFEDVTLPSNLLSKARAYLEEHDSSITTLTVKAIDLHVLDDIYVRFNVGDKVHVYSKPNSIDTYMMISERTRNLNNPDKDELTLGKVIETFTSGVDKPGMNIESDENALNYVDVEYGLSDSSTIAPTIWSTDSPVWTAGKYIWQRTKCVYINGTITYSNIACIQGAKGEDGKDGQNGADGKDGIDGTNGKDGAPGTDGTDGRGILSVEEQYYLSSSKTSLLDGTWSISCPEWKKGYYIWTRSKITWMNPTETTYTDAVLSTALNQANENANNAIESIPSDDHIKDIAKLQTNLLLGASGGYMEVLNDAEEKPIALRFMDSMIASSAKNVLLINQNGIGFSNTGVNGPFYNAWTIDGHLSADVLYTGILQDRAGNFKLNMDTGEISVQKLTLNTPDLIFGVYPDGNFIEITETESSDGILFKGTGKILMTPSGAFDVRNIVSNVLKNQLQISAEGTSNNISLWNNLHSNANYFANSITMSSQTQVDGSVNNAVNIYNYLVGSNTESNYISMSNNGSNKYLKINNDGSRNRLWLTRSGNNTHLELANYSTNAGSDIYSNALEFDSSSGILMFNFEYGYPGNFKRTAVTGMKMYNVDLNINSKDDMRLTASGLLYLNSSDDYVTKIWYNGAKLKKAVTISGDNVFISVGSMCFRVTGMTNGCLAVESITYGNQSESSGGKYRFQKVDYSTWA